MDESCATRDHLLRRPGEGLAGGARGLPRPGLRAATRTCAGRSNRMLAAHAAGGQLPRAARPRPRRRPPTSRRSTTAAGTVIGPYKLLQQIGEGGMGTVFMAEQTEPVRRKVALKIIKPGMDSRQVIARFEAERQALALMDHPNIAKVLDAGTTDGRPALLRHGAGQGRADHAVLRRAPPDAPRSGWNCSSRSARRSSTPTRRASSTATSSRPTSWSASTTASRCPR